MIYVIIKIVWDYELNSEEEKINFSNQNWFLDVRKLEYLILASIGFHVLPVLFEFKAGLEILFCVPAYIFYSATYIHLFLIYSFSRIDDLSWGTKGLDA